MDSKYSVSFTAAGLSLAESVTLAEVFLRQRTWREVKKIVKENNLLQSRTNSRTTRVLTELVPRLELLNEDQLELLVDGAVSDKKYLLWFAVCKRYALVGEFAVEVLHEKYLSRIMKLTDLDYDAFYNRKVEWNADLEAISDLTRKKIRQVIFHMMRESDMLTDDNAVLRPLFSQRFTALMKAADNNFYRYFPIESV